MTTKIKNENFEKDLYYDDLIEYKYFNGPPVGSFNDFIKKRNKHIKTIVKHDKYINKPIGKIYMIADKLSTIAITSTNKKELFDTFNEIVKLISDISYKNGSFEIRRCLFSTKFFQLLKGNHYNTDRWNKYMKYLYIETYNMVFYDILPNNPEVIGINTIKETNNCEFKLNTTKLDNIVINTNKPLEKKKLLERKKNTIKIFIDLIKDYKKILTKEKNEELLKYVNYKIKVFKDIIAYAKEEINFLKSSNKYQL